MSNARKKRKLKGRVWVKPMPVWKILQQQARGMVALMAKKQEEELKGKNDE